MTRYLSLAEFFYLVEQVTGIDAAGLIRASRVDLADSALHGPQADFGDEDFYPDPYGRPPCSRVGLVEPSLPDANNRAAWACMALFVDLNDGPWSAGRRDVDEAIEAMLAVAAREVDEAWLAAWQREGISSAR